MELILLCMHIFIERLAHDVPQMKSDKVDNVAYGEWICLVIHATVSIVSPLSVPWPMNPTTYQTKVDIIIFMSKSDPFFFFFFNKRHGKQIKTE